ncbi:F-box only protein 21-like isoform X2 [Homarus americanus]|uniref:F-box only protein 21-like isoform X2 n=1 Tax=Homarus americanus TaxID=6706 RepID=UPI001C460FAE|nr:F-box only protein 21-like isoform X2 [Homarus americanus]
MESVYHYGKFDSLPDELLLKILCCDCITICDLGRAAATCTRLKNIVDTQDLWRQKLKYHWPKVWDELPNKNEVTDWREEVHQLLCFFQETHKLVSNLSPRLYQDLRLTANLHLTTPVYNEIDALISSTYYAPFYVLCALRTIVEDGAEHPREPTELVLWEQQQQQPVQPRPNWQRVLPAPGSSRHIIRYENMTEKYYALKVMSHVNQSICKQEWEEFMSCPPSHQSLEMGAMLMARWFQPHISDVSIKQMTNKIDSMAKACLNMLLSAHPDHPALTTPMIHRDQPLEESKWSTERCRQLFNCIIHVLFVQMRMTGSNEDYYQLKNSLLNEVLKSKKGIPIILSIVYKAVCHRLGLLLEPVNYPCYFVLRWKIPGEELREGRAAGVEKDESLLASCEPMQVFQRMIRNIMNVAQMQSQIFDLMELFCPATELMCLLIPTDRNVQELLLRIYYSSEVHFDRIVIGCRRLLAQGPSPLHEEMLSDCEQILKNQNESPKPIIPNQRNREIAYATGLVMQHKRYHYTCVIFGWDKECKMPAAWVRRMGVHNLQYKTKQPFYNVLVYDGSHRYAAQENLEVASDPNPVTHPDIGKYFKEFRETHYIPNNELQQQYPDDEPVRNENLRVRNFL